MSKSNSPSLISNQQSKDKITQTQASIVTATAYQGPIPAAEELQKYESVLPGASERILKMAEKEQDARLENNKAGMQNVFNIEKERNLIAKRGQWFAISMGIFVLCYATYLAFLGATVQSASVVGAVLVGVIVAFVAGRKKEDKDIK